jgi:RNA polymerase sigma factor (sigma-70 family)
MILKLKIKNLFYNIVNLKILLTNSKIYDKLLLLKEKIMQQENIKDILNNKEKLNDFILKNKNLVIYVIQKIQPSILRTQEKEDFIQEGLLALYQSLLTYNPSKNVDFSVFAYINIKCKIIKVIQYKKRLKRDPIKPLYSLDAKVFENITLAESISDNNNIENIILEKIHYKYLINKLKNKLNSTDKQILDYLLEDKSQAEIGRIMNVSRQRIGQKVMKIRETIKKMCII